MKQTNPNPFDFEFSSLITTALAISPYLEKSSFKSSSRKSGVGKFFT